MAESKTDHSEFTTEYWREENIEEMLRITSDPLERVELPPEHSRLEVPADFRGNINIMLLGASGQGKSSLANHLKLAGKFPPKSYEGLTDELMERNRYPGRFLSTRETEKKWGKTEKLKIIPIGPQINIIDAPGDLMYLQETGRGIWLANLHIVVVSIHETEQFFANSYAIQVETWARKVSGDRQIGFIFAVTKMDQVCWHSKRFTEFEGRLRLFIPEGISYEVIPVSGVNEQGNVWKRNEDVFRKWYRGRTLVESVCWLSMESEAYRKQSRRLSQNLRFVVVRKDGDTVFGQVIQGMIETGESYVLLPDEEKVDILNIHSDGIDLDKAGADQIVELKVAPKMNGICTGSIISGKDPYRAVNEFKATIFVRGDVMNKDICIMHSNAWHYRVRVMDLKLIEDGNKVTPMENATAGEKAIVTLKCLDETYLVFEKRSKKMDKIVLTANGMLVALGDVRRD